MKDKKFFIFAVFIIFFLTAGQALFSLQTDFYGTWTAEIEEDGDVATVTLVISESSMIFKAKFYSGNTLIDNVEEKMEILSWTDTFNTDANTNNIFPDGVLAGVFDGEYTDSIEIFISKDKTSFIIPEMNVDDDLIIVFIKQKNS